MKQLPNFLPSGYRLHRYCIESVLGSGGFGVTYKAVHEVLPIYYAVKEYLPVELAQRGLDGIGVYPNALGQAPSGLGKPTWYEWGRERFLDEARALARIRHPYVARVQDYFADNGTAYIAMDYEEGETLNELLNRESPLPEERLRRVLEEMLLALEAVHAQGYLHRDIKPHNLYIRARDGCTMLIDFGSARSILSSYTRTVTSVWSAGYAPPEQYATDADDYGPWTDLYALGAVLYRCITGERPLDAPSRQMGKKTMVPAVRTGAGRYGLGLLAAVDRALALRPEDRFQSVAEMRAALIKTQTAAQGGTKKQHPMLLAELSAPPLAAAQEGTKPPGTVIRDRLKDGSLGPEMVVIPAGTFQMGSPKSEEGRFNNERLHRVRIKKPFAMGKYQVTFEEYDCFAEATGRAKPDDRGWGRGRRPVINASWNDAAAYAEWLSGQTGQNYYLPTEAEWEYAARAGTQTAYWWGDAIGSNKANCCGCGSHWDGKQTAPVGSFAANPFGLHDTAGNVLELTSSEYGTDYKGGEERCTGNNTVSAFRVIRGGSWKDFPRWVRAAPRSGIALDCRDEAVGFRLARTLRL